LLPAPLDRTEPSIRTRPCRGDRLRRPSLAQSGKCKGCGFPPGGRQQAASRDL